MYSEEEFGLAFDLAMDSLKGVSIPLPDFGEGRQPLPIFDARGPNQLLLPPLKARLWEQAVKESGVLHHGRPHGHQATLGGPRPSGGSLG